MAVSLTSLITAAITTKYLGRELAKNMPGGALAPSFLLGLLLGHLSGATIFATIGLAILFGIVSLGTHFGFFYVLQPK